MNYTRDSLPRCVWPDCSSNASVEVYTEDMMNSAWLCSFHKRAAAVNLEQYGKIFAPQSNSKVVRPGEAVNPQLPQIKPIERPGQEPKKKVEVKPDWKKEAVKAAENKASPDKKSVESVKPAPRKR